MLASSFVLIISISWTLTKAATVDDSEKYRNEFSLKCFNDEDLLGHVFIGANEYEKVPDDPQKCFNEKINNTTEWSDYYGNNCNDYNASMCNASSSSCVWNIGLPWQRPKQSSKQFLVCSAKAACCNCGGGYEIAGKYGECRDREGLFNATWLDSEGRGCDWYSLQDRCFVYGGFNSNFGYTANQACCVCQGGGYISDIMIMYSPLPETDDDAFETEKLIAEGILYTNLAFKMSGATTRVRVALLAEDLSGFNTTSNHIALVFKEYYSQRYYYNQSYNYEQLRKEYGADIFALVFDSDDMIGGGWSKRNYADSQFWKRRTQVLVPRSRVATSFSLAHEIAHIYGCNHDQISDADLNPDDGISYQWGYTFNQTQQEHFHTIMSYGCRDPDTGEIYGQGPNLTCPRIPRFSNVNYLYNNQHVGDHFKNNVRMIERAAPCVSQFYTSTNRTFCPGNETEIDDGKCQNTIQNTQKCFWEGGDCCIETCRGPSCPTNNKYCKNPLVNVGTTIVNSFNGKCLDFSSSTKDQQTVVISDCQVNSSRQKQSQLWYYNLVHNQIINKSNQKCLTIHHINESIVILLQECVSGTKEQQWCSYETSQSTRILPYHNCSDIKQDGIMNMVMDIESSNVVIELIHWKWDLSSAEWLIPDGFFS